MKTNKFMPLVLAIAGLGIAAVSNGCSAASALCCKDYNPGADMSTGTFTDNATANVQLRAVAQGSGDLAAVAGAAQADVLAACKGIAVDLGEAPDDPAGMSGTDLMNAWCAKAKAKLDPLKGQFTLKFQPAQCSLDIQASANCKASCTGGAKCDFKANPPKCTGGKLEISCKGGCTASGMAPSVSCEGGCSGMCQGSCEATSGSAMVDCKGKCEGTCSVAPAMDGTCMGTCSGKCTYAGMPPMVMCQGKCTGQCSAKCTASPGSLSVKCDGSCDADFEPVQCTGGKLEGGCMIDAKCEGSCNASASAKAECTPPQFELSVMASAPANLRGTLEANIPKIGLVVQGRAKLFADSVGGMVTITGGLVGSGLDARGLACVGFIADNVVKTNVQFQATLTAATSIATSMGM
jgi:hypothetical protein